MEVAVGAFFAPVADIGLRPALDIRDRSIGRADADHPYLRHPTARAVSRCYGVSMSRTLAEVPIYLDHHAHTPMDVRVHAVLVEAYQQFDVNPHSHSIAGDRAREAVEQARARVAELLGVGPSEIVFTSGATEANNLAIAGLAPLFLRHGRHRILVSPLEHPSVLTAADRLADAFEVERLKVGHDGLIDLVDLEARLATDVGLVSVGLANHEVGAIQPLYQISAMCRSVGALVHSDLAQAAGKIPLTMDGVDLASLSAHKIHGPLGIGALMVRRRLRRQIAPLLTGGAQEAGTRAGTVPTPLCVGRSRQGRPTSGQPA